MTRPSGRLPLRPAADVLQPVARRRETEALHGPVGYHQCTFPSQCCCRPTHGLSWCFRIQGLGGFHPVPWYNSNCTKERSSRTIQVPGTAWIPSSPRPLKHQLSPCVDCDKVRPSSPGGNSGGVAAVKLRPDGHFRFTSTERGSPSFRLSLVIQTHLLHTPPCLQALRRKIRSPLIQPNVLRNRSSLASTCVAAGVQGA